ncbi:hypothetical protein [Paenibacillus senegalensis]|uniref:hypothetical protein n=1 Tax=Paenibacillus senegalensis TaxID=1465766 RepID=UPI0012F90AAB|nr:hypothetical protein [Paenibacillus senegalensis]
MDLAVDLAVHLAVHLAVDLAVDLAVHLAVNWVQVVWESGFGALNLADSSGEATK